MEGAQNRRLDDAELRDRGLSGLLALGGAGVGNNNGIVPYKEIAVVQKLSHNIGESTGFIVALGENATFKWIMDGACMEDGFEKN